jgi:hypothetical protein
MRLLRIRRPSKMHGWIYLVDGVHECSQKAMPRRDPLYGTYTADELVALVYGRYAPNLAPLSLKEWEVWEVDYREGWHCERV